ncbi:RDD family protein [Yinghuangia sp. ASG 101]|uniref:RDD family protein n=1 Tax=Yinghuangia sp. ASG 101 TaxID=2896848 RepID=UPI001E58AD8D|nr:RDD family protein [Yinghuangia sp. ASG 101]UGQ09551.1 RDD family protein [Yinghuangia sp. ASG 101]
MSDLVIGEAVALDLRPARLASRALAFTLDLLLQAGCLLLAVWGLGSLLSDVDEALATAVVLALLVAVVVGWPVAWETATRGKSPGKMALGLRVVRDDGGPIRFRHSLVRGLVGVFADFWTTGGCGAVISSLASTRGKRLGDQAAGTFVVRERTPGARHVPVAMHPAAAGWAAGLDLSGLNDELALRSRQYLGRLAQLDPAVAASLGVGLAGEVASRIGVPPPTGVHPADFLAAVLAERQRRAYQRAQPTTQPTTQPQPAGWAPAGASAHAPQSVPPPPSPAAPAPGPAAVPPTQAGRPAEEASPRTGFKPPV